MDTRLDRMSGDPLAAKILQQEQEDAGAAPENFKQMRHDDAPRYGSFDLFCPTLTNKLRIKQASGSCSCENSCWLLRVEDETQTIRTLHITNL